MANATVEKIKDLGLRHGEKVVVCAAAALCIVFAAQAVSRPTIELTPEQMKKVAQSADSNINRQHDPAVIAEKLVEDGMTNPRFEKIVDLQIQNPLKGDPFKIANPWITPEPGAGLIREQPALVAPMNLYAHPGRGGALLFALDDAGKRIPQELEKEDAAAAPRGKRQTPRAGRRFGGDDDRGGMGAMGGMAGRALTPEEEAAEKKAFEEQKKKLEQKLVGTVDETEKAELKKEMEELEQSQLPMKEVYKGLRWVALTATLDHKAIRENYFNALKNPAAADPYYKAVDIQRQERKSDGSWSDWADVNRAENLKILDHPTSEDPEELTPDDVRIPELVDPLPLLNAGFWEKVHVASLVPLERREVQKGAFMPRGRPGFGGRGRFAMDDDDDRGGMMGAMGAMGPGMAGMGRGMVGAGPGMMGAGPGMMGRNDGGGRGMGMGGNFYPGVENLNFPKSQADSIMVRKLDFTVQPDTTYRFRLRVVVRNPNLGREDVAPGVETTAAELSGPWSEPTDEVTMPADVTPYVFNKTPSDDPKSEHVQFQVARWDPESGFTLVRSVNARPGQLIGETLTTQIPATDGTETKSRNVDFNSRQVVLDAMGGVRPIPAMPSIGGLRYEVPALSLVMRPDGGVVVRAQARDLHDEVRKDMVANYDREIKAAEQARDAPRVRGMQGVGPAGGGRGNR